MASLAASYHVWIMWSLAERVKRGIANTALLFDREGRIRLRYRKVHLCLEADEHIAYVAGRRFPVVAVEKIKVGVMICFDRHYPEAARELRLKGAHLILHPTATDWFKPDPGSINTAMMRTRAYENRCFILSVNQVNYGGGSALFGPWGEIVASAGEGEEILYWPLDLELIEKMPENFFELLNARRPDTYHRLTKPCDSVGERWIFVISFLQGISSFIVRGVLDEPKEISPQLGFSFPFSSRPRFLSAVPMN